MLIKMAIVRVRTKRAGGWMMTALIVSLLGVTASATPPEELFQSLYGKRYAEAMKSAEHADNLALAKELIELARNASEPPTVAVLAEKAYALTQSDIAMADMAIEASMLLASTSPQNAVRARAQLLELLPRQFSAADGDEKQRVGKLLVSVLTEDIEQALEAKEFMQALQTSQQLTRVAASLSDDDRRNAQALYEKVARLRRVHTKIANLNRQIDGSPYATSLVDQLVELYLVELGDYDHAIGLSKSASPTMQVRLKQLSEPISEQSTEALLAGGEWLQSLCRAAPRSNQLALLDEAAKRYEQITSRDDVPELVRLRADAALKKLDELRTSTESPDAGPVDLLAEIDPKKDAVSGEWVLRNGRLVVRSTEKAELVARRDVPTNFTLEMTFVIHQGRRPPYIAIPVGDGRCVLVVVGGFHEGIAGLDTIDGKRASDNATTKRMPRLPEKEAIDLSIGCHHIDDGRVTIAVKLAGKVVVDWTGAAKSLALSDAFKTKADDAISLILTSSDQSVVEITRLRLEH